MAVTPAISGQLYVVATPIGNLEDISQRAISTLKRAEVVLAEDTRHSRRLFEHYHIDTPLQAWHAHNENHKASLWLEKLRQGAYVALISDAGTPIIADPGLPLVRLARDAGIPVVAIPGPSAIVAALSVAGLPCHHFCFEGFLAARSAARLSRLEQLAQEERTMVFYEAPHRLLVCLEDLRQVFGADRRIAIVKEMTKSFEQYFGGTLAQVLALLQSQPDKLRGEFVLMVTGCQSQAENDLSLQQTMSVLLAENLTLKQAATIGSKLCGCSKKLAYQAGLSVRGHL